MSEDKSKSEVQGQSVLPEMVGEMGYESIILKPTAERFCWEYVLRGDNGSQAYKTVKPRVKDSTARVEASKLLTNPDIRARVEQIRVELNRKYRVTADDLMQYHGKVLKIDRCEFIAEDNTQRDIHDLDSEARSIVDIDFRCNKDGLTVGTYSVPQHAQSAVELARILGMHKEKFELTGKNDGPVEHLVTDDVDKMDALRKKMAVISGVVKT